jgi:hypothetical protein
MPIEQCINPLPANAPVGNSLSAPTAPDLTSQNTTTKQHQLTQPRFAPKRYRHTLQQPTMNITIPRTLQLALAIALASQFASEADASKRYVKMLPNGANVPDTPAIGHPDGTGEDSETNAFGDAFADADNTWTKEFCEADTDGDGQTNGQELGDPCCEWTVGATPLWTTGVSHPGDATKTSDPSLWANACGASTAEETTTESVTDAPTTTDSTSEGTETTTSTEDATTEPTASSTESAESTESADESHDSHDASAYSSSDASNSSSTATTTGAEKCVSDLAVSTRALRASN